MQERDEDGSRPDHQKSVQVILGQEVVCAPVPDVTHETKTELARRGLRNMVSCFYSHSDIRGVVVGDTGPWIHRCLLIRYS